MAAVYKTCGMTDACEASGAKLNDDFGYSSVAVDGAVIKRMDCIDAFLKADSEKYDIVFIDPPYDLRAVPATLESLLENKLLKPTSVVVCESREKDVLDGYDGLDKYFEVIKKAVYGIANITIFKMRTEDR